MVSEEVSVGCEEPLKSLAVKQDRLLFLWVQESLCISGDRRAYRWLSCFLGPRILVGVPTLPLFES